MWVIVRSRYGAKPCSWGIALMISPLLPTALKFMHHQKPCYPTGLCYGGLHTQATRVPRNLVLEPQNSLTPHLFTHHPHNAA